MDRSVTAIIATYNRARYIEQAIDSILAQREPVLQLIVVDDGSTDDTATRVAKYGPPVEYVHKPNGGKSSAVNLGLTRAHGEWVWLFDDDDIAMPEATQLLLDALEAEPGADLAYGGQVIADESPDGRLVDHREVLATVEPDDALLLNVLQGFCFRLQAMLIRRDCFDQIGLLDERFLRGQDYELMVRLVQRFRATRVMKPILTWRQHAGERGPAQLTHTAHERDRHWGRFDALLGREVRATYGLGEFLVPRSTSSELSAAERSAALFHRAAVMATKGLVEEFAEDLGASFAALPRDAHLGPGQRKLMIRTGGNPRWLARVAEAPGAVTQALHQLPRQPAMREAAACIARALFYETRHATGKSALRRRRYLRCALALARIAGPRALARAYGR